MEHQLKLPGPDFKWAAPLVMAPDDIRTHDGEANSDDPGIWTTIGEAFSDPRRSYVDMDFTDAARGVRVRVYLGRDGEPHDCYAQVWLAPDRIYGVLGRPDLDMAEVARAAGGGGIDVIVRLSEVNAITESGLPGSPVVSLEAMFGPGEAPEWGAFMSGRSDHGLMLSLRFAPNGAVRLTIHVAPVVHATWQLGAILKRNTCHEQALAERIVKIAGEFKEVKHLREVGACHPLWVPSFGAPVP